MWKTWAVIEGGFDLFVWNSVSLSLDNYLAMDVACTLNYPKPNPKDVVPQPCGNDTQKCEKCEGDCPKGQNLKYRKPTDFLESHSNL